MSLSIRISQLRKKEPGKVLSINLFAQDTELAAIR